MDKRASALLKPRLRLSALLKLQYTDDRRDRTPSVGRPLSLPSAFRLLSPFFRFPLQSSHLSTPISPAPVDFLALRSLIVAHISTPPPSSFHVAPLRASIAVPSPLARIDVSPFPSRCIPSLPTSPSFSSFLFSHLHLRTPLVVSLPLLLPSHPVPTRSAPHSPILIPAFILPPHPFVRINFRVSSLPCFAFPSRARTVLPLSSSSSSPHYPSSSSPPPFRVILAACSPSSPPFRPARPPLFSSSSSSLPSRPSPLRSPHPPLLSSSSSLSALPRTHP
ncbi:hypothetical protein B0H11DRAFT_1225855 [Mycena galericulata]|nr:hypothetical protein B0H11DRAFT_1225855 [Mycena galericulata]